MSGVPMVKPIPMPMATRLTISVARFANRVATSARNSAPAAEAASPKASTAFTPNRSMSLPDTGAPTPANAARTITT